MKNKQKTKKIAVKRFKVTKNGKLMHRASGMRHIRRNKTKSRQRRQDRMKALTQPKQIRLVKTLLNK
jgi:ribosomal protein L35